MKIFRKTNMPEVTRELLDGFSHYLAKVTFDFETSTFIFQFVDDPDRCSRTRTISFRKVHELQITSRELDDEFMDSVISIHRRSKHYYFLTERLELAFRCEDFLAENQLVTIAN